METIDELQAFLADATQDGVWGRLLDRGAAWAIMREDGALPPDAPPLGELIDTDLAEYGFSVLRASLALKDAGGQSRRTRARFLDAASRRIVCLSAILPDGEELDDLTGWIRHDAPGDAVRSSWRPTRQRFGTLIWRGTSARLNFDLNVRGPFLARFVEQIPPRGSQKKPFPREMKDLTLFAAWNFSAQDKRTLVFCTQANWVEGYGVMALDLVNRGYLPSLLDKPEAISRALEVGREWLGGGHPAVESLKIGVAIHHGGLLRSYANWRFFSLTACLKSSSLRQRFRRGLTSTPRFC